MSRTPTAIKLERQAKATLERPAGGYNRSRRLPRCRPNRISARPSLPRNRSSSSSAKSSAAKRVDDPRRLGPEARQLSASPISATTPTRAAQPTWDSSPTCCPATFPSPRPAPSPNTPICPPRPANRCRRCSTRQRTAISAHCSSSAPILSREPQLDPAALKNTFVIVQDLFLTETAALADVVFPAASLYEKSGTVTNTFGDVQLVRKAADRAGVKSDFEILVRLAGGMGVDVRTLVPFGKRGTSPPISASRAARSPARPTVTRSGLKPTASNPSSAPSIRSPFSTKSSASSPATRSTASIFSRATTCTPNLRLHAGFVPVSALAAPELIVPAHDTLFTSGTLGRYSRALRQLEQHQAKETGRDRR